MKVLDFLVRYRWLTYLLIAAIILVPDFVEPFKSHNHGIFNANRDPLGYYIGLSTIFAFMFLGFLLGYQAALRTNGSKK
jgi:hypothetical protein